MKTSEPQSSGPGFHACCPGNSITRREFIKVAGGTTLSMAALSGLSWSALANSGYREPGPLVRQSLVVKPILVYSAPEYRHQSSWRSWGGIQTDEDAREEISRIKGELDLLKSRADFPVDFLPAAAIKGPRDVGVMA